MLERETRRETQLVARMSADLFVGPARESELCGAERVDLLWSD